MQNGVYDESCIICQGDGRYYDIDEDSCDKEVLGIINSYYEAEAENRAEIEIERRMGY